MELKETIASFGLEVIALPDMSTSLSGHLLTGFSRSPAAGYRWIPPGKRSARS